MCIIYTKDKMQALTASAFKELVSLKNPTGQYLGRVFDPELEFVAAQAIALSKGQIYISVERYLEDKSGVYRDFAKKMEQQGWKSEFLYSGAHGRYVFTPKSYCECGKECGQEAKI